MGKLAAVVGMGMGLAGMLVYQSPTLAVISGVTVLVNAAMLGLFLAEEAEERTEE